MILVLLFAAPMVPARVASYDQSSNTTTGPPLKWFSSDPGGVYSGYSFGNGTYTMNLTTYERFAQDPYTVLCRNSGVNIEGSVVRFTCSPTNASPLPLPSNALGSVTYWLVGHGGLYFDNKYSWK